MSSAKMIGIDSCPIEGFNSSKEVANILDVDTTEFDIAVLVALGTHTGEIPEKKRLNIDVLVEYI